MSSRSGDGVIVTSSDVVKRKTRIVNLIKPIIKPINKPKTKTLHTCVFYSFNTSYLLIGLNEFGEIVNVWSTTDNKTNITNVKYTFVKKPADLVDIVTRASNLHCLYMNDGTLLTLVDYALIKNTNIVHFNDAELLPLLEKLRSSSVASAAAAAAECKSHYTPPSYSAIRQLDANITLAEYQFIYLQS